MRKTVYWLTQALMVAVGIMLVQLNTPLWVAIGTSVVATGICGAVVFAYVERTGKLSSQIDALQRFGLERIHAGRGVRIREEYDLHLRRHPDRIDVLGFGLRSFVEDYGDHFGAWSARCPVRILLLDPEYPDLTVTYARQRDVEEGNAPGTIERDVKTFAKRVGPLLAKYPDTFEVRLYRCLPAVNVFRIGDVLFWGPYLLSDQSRNMPTFEVREGGLLFGRFVRHFDSIWQSPTFSRPVPGIWFDP